MTKSNLRTAPQILEHYLPIKHPMLNDYLQYAKDGLLIETILKAMRHYARVKNKKMSFWEEYNQIKDELREEVKDEIYEEARRNLIEQY